MSRARGKIAATAVVLATAAGSAAACSSSTSNASGGASASHSGTLSPAPRPSRPGTDGTHSPPADTPNSAQRAAAAVQGPAAPATAGQLAALRAQGPEIARLTPRQMAGQRVIYSYNGLSAPGWLLTDIRNGDVGGVIFFAFNISSEAQIRAVIAKMVAANASPQNPARRYPLLLMTDQEGGLVKRLPGPPDISERQIGSSPDPASAAAAAGSSAAANLRGVGMNVNLAPVIDVYRQAGDFDDQFQRSFSMNPAVVSLAGAAFIRAQQAGHVAATAKHFPGLGAASAAANTDNGPVVINLTAATLRTFDEVPYQAAIKAGSKLVMLSWAKYPALDGSLPAGLSPRIVVGELRDRVGYQGVTITDALGAGALGAYGTLQNKTMLAARAGMDALLCTAVKPLPGWKCLNGLLAGFRDGAVGKTSFEAGLAQLLQLRATLPS